MERVKHIGRTVLAAALLAMCFSTIANAVYVSDINITGSGHRVYPATGVPRPVSDTATTTSVFIGQDSSTETSVYNGTRWINLSFTEVTCSLGTLSSGKNYDVFLYSNSGTATCALSAAWTSDTARNDALARQDGVWVLSSDHTRRWMGTFRTISTTATTDTVLQRYVYSHYNQIQRYMVVNDSTDSWTYNSATFQAARGQSGNAVEYVVGDADVLVRATAHGLGLASSGNTTISVGIGINSTTTNSAILYGGQSLSSFINNVRADYRGYPSLGYVKVQWIESCASSPTCTFYGDAGLTAQFHSGLMAEIAQ